MNKPLQSPPIPDDAIGPLDANGEQIWSAEEKQASDRMWADADFLHGLTEAERQLHDGEWLPHEAVIERSNQMKARWFADKALTSPPRHPNP